MVNGPINLPDPINTGPVAPAAKVGGPAAKASAKAPEQAPAAQAPDQVTLSPAAVQARALAQLAAALPEVQQDRVAQLQADLSSLGNNSAINAKIAEKLLSDI